jgi:hypothetical protein
MAGVQVVLHPRDDDRENRKNETRNLGLQSIVHRENALTELAISQVQTQKKLITQINGLLDSVSALLTNYTLIANNIYQIMYTAYMADTTKTQKFSDIQQEALEMI